MVPNQAFEWSLVHKLSINSRFFQPLTYLIRQGYKIFVQNFAFYRCNFTLIDKNSSDRELLKACEEHDRRGQEGLYRKYYPLMMPICMTYTKDEGSAIDVFNRSMLKVFQSLNSYSGTGELGAWIRRIVVNVCIDFLRSEAKFIRNTQLDDARNVYFEERIISFLAANEILILFNELPANYRLVVNMRILEGYSHKEIAAKLEISVGTSKWYLNKGREMLKEKLKHLGIERVVQ